VNRNDVLRQVKRMHVSELQRTMPLSVTLIEDLRDGGRVSCQFRSWDEGLALGVASALGGGGHSRAAGATLRGSLAEVRARVLAAMRAQLEARSASEEQPQ
jgi:nanoRNase/pAp phosphatase (c-di-AMP/oligoRNAs hydrolase)